MYLFNAKYLNEFMNESMGVEQSKKQLLNSIKSIDD